MAPSPQVGDQLPAFELTDHAGSAAAVPPGGAVVLVFYRGFW